MTIRIQRIVAMVAAAPLALSVIAASVISDAVAQIDDKPLKENWAPTEWGPDDKVGAPNRTTPAIVLKAVQLVK